MIFTAVAEQALEIRKALLAVHDNAKQSSSPKGLPLNGLKKLVAQSMTSLSLLYYACEETDQAYVLHREALRLFADIPMRSKPLHKPVDEEKTNQGAEKPNAKTGRFNMTLKPLDEEARKAWEAFKSKRPDVKSIALSVAKKINDDEHWQASKTTTATCLYIVTVDL